MPDLTQMSRVLYRHQWQSLRDWSLALDDLADLSDDQIAELVCLGKTSNPQPRGRATSTLRRR
jgi:hypothetical protein